MKKKLLDLLSQDEGYLDVNSIARLHRWTKDWKNDDVDRLEVTFDSPTGRVSFYTQEIISREPSEIMRELESAVKNFADRWTNETINELKAGKIS